MALPANIGYGTVVGRFLASDGSAASGTVSFRASVAALRNITALPAPVTVGMGEVECALDADGYLAGPDGVALLATDDADNNPVGWTWGVKFALEDAYGQPVRIPAFSFALPGGAEVDLTEASPVPDAGGTYYVVGPRGDPGPPGAMEFPFSWGDATPAAVATLAAGRTAFSAEIHITQAFNGAGASLALGYAGSPEAFVAASEVAPAAIGSYVTAPVWTAGADTPILLEIAPGSGAASGRGIVRIII